MNAHLETAFERFDRLCKTAPESLERRDFELALKQLYRMRRDLVAHEVPTLGLVISRVEGQFDRDEMMEGLSDVITLIRRALAEYDQMIPKSSLCLKCGKRQKHFGDLCKRCADAAGVRPRGKVI